MDVVDRRISVHRNNHIYTYKVNTMVTVKNSGKKYAPKNDVMLKQLVKHALLIWNLNSSGYGMIWPIQ